MDCSASPGEPGRERQARVGDAESQRCARRLKRPGLGERGEGLFLVVVDVEDGVELGDLHQVVDALGEIEELQLPAAVLYRCEGTGQLAEAGAVDIGDFSEVQENLLEAIV